MPKMCIPLLPYCDRKDKKFFGVSCTVNKNVSNEEVEDTEGDKPIKEKT